MRKKERVLTVNDENTIPETVVVVEVCCDQTVDLTNPRNKVYTFRCGAAQSAKMENGQWTRTKYIQFASTPDFWRWLDSVRRAGRPVCIYTSTAQVSLSTLGFWEALTSEEFSLLRPAPPQHVQYPNAKRMLRNTRPYVGILVTDAGTTACVCYHRTRYKCTLVDVSNYIRQPIARVARSNGTPYPDYPGQDSPTESLLAAATIRCEAVSEIVRRHLVWHAKQELGKFPLSIGGTAMAAFRHRFMRHKIVLPDDQEARDWERQGYYGGRVEALWCGSVIGNRFSPPSHAAAPTSLFEDRPASPFHLVDARSMYGAVMQFCSVPIACVEDQTGVNVPPLPPVDMCDAVMASVLISSHTDTYPCRQGNRVLYPRGQYHTTLCGPELQHAIRKGHIKRCNGWKRYEIAPALRWYAEAIWAQREQATANGDEQTAGVCKTMLAVLYGKFAQRKSRWTTITGHEPPDAWCQWSSIDAATGTVRRYRSIGWEVQQEEDAGDAPHCFPAIAAWITSHARSWLRSWIEIAGRGNVLYVHTDALIVTDQGRRNLTDHGILGDHGIGSLKVDYSHDDITIRGPSSYRLGDKEIVSGRALRNLRVDGRLYTSEIWPSIECQFFGADRDRLVATDLVGTISEYTTPGTVGPGGWIIPPTMTLLEAPRCSLTQRQTQEAERKSQSPTWYQEDSLFLTRSGYWHTRTAE